MRPRYGSIIVSHNIIMPVVNPRNLILFKMINVVAF